MKLLPLRLVSITTPPSFLAAAVAYSPPPPNQCHLALPYFRCASYQWHRGFSNLGFRPPYQPPPPPHHFPGDNFRPHFRAGGPQRAPDHRDWEFSKSVPPHNYTTQFKVLSYNLLAEYLAINHRGRLYFHIPRHILDWGWRKRSISFELGLWSADILCFQEVDRFQDLEEDLKLRGYSGTWKMRTGDPIDGCAIFWRVSRFRLLHEECIEYKKLGLRDNVAQICVFELVNQNYGYSNSPGRLSSSNKVVICNIHVLYNPRRGEIKLGQVRVLLDRAHAVSKHWDNAPVVLCGDFNCTPKSPLYNYISEQKLDLSDLPRDEVSGQASAEIRPQWQFNPNVRPPQAADFRGDATQTSNCGEIGHLGSSDVHKERNSGFPVSCSPLTTELKMCDSASGEEDCNNESVVSAHETRTMKAHHGVGYCENEAKSASSVSSTGLKEPSISQERENLFDKNSKDANESFAVNSSPEDILPSLTRETSYTNICEDGNNGDMTKTSSEVSVSTKSTPNVVLNEKMENLSLDGLEENNEGDMGLGEDSVAFLAELHDKNDSVSNDVNSEPVNQVFNTYDPSAWTPMETESATGSSDCTLMEHSLKLKSSYTEVEDISCTRGSHGEPLVTSYNRCFLGTVDYIWRSEGLKTVRVLAPIPKKAMQWTPGFPTKKWGSDHIALVSELAFTNNTVTRKTESS